MTIDTIKKDLKALGYKVTVKTYSDFKSIIVRDHEGITINTSTITAQHIEKYKKFYDYKKTITARIYDGFMPVTL
jgi:flavodoxin